jgi:hypothetical protein
MSGIPLSQTDHEKSVFELREKKKDREGLYIYLI